MKVSKETGLEFLKNVVAEKCPNCGNAHVFKKSAGIFTMPEMHEECEACHYKFDREPGYFLGAMYVSYAMAVATGIAVFLTLQFFLPDIPTIYIPLTMILVIVAIAKKNFKLSRIIYMHMFPW